MWSYLMSLTASIYLDVEWDKKFYISFVQSFKKNWLPTRFINRINHPRTLFGCLPNLIYSSLYKRKQIRNRVWYKTSSNQIWETKG